MTNIIPLGPPTVPRLQLLGINKSFGASHVLRNIDFDVHAGEVVGLVGENGAGKSTLMKIIAGAYMPDSGQILLDGRPVRFATPREAWRNGIQMIYQDLALADNLDVVHNLFLGAELKHRFGSILDELKMEQRALQVLHELEIDLPSLRVPVATLSGGQRQGVAVAKALLDAANVILFDEPTAALGTAQSQNVLNLVRHLRAQGIGIVFISQNLADVFDLADRVIVLRLGKRVATYDLKMTMTPQSIKGIS